MANEVNKVINLKDIKAVETPSLDLWQYDKKEVVIASAIIDQVPSKFVETENKMQWILKVVSVPICSIGDKEDKIEFHASELFNLIQDEKGVLQGFPTGEGSNLMKFMKDIRIKDPEKLKDLQEVVDSLIGKKALIKCFDKIKDGKKSTFLKFRY